LEGADVKLSTKVTAVETTSAGIVKVFAENGQFDFDEVVITTPLGWLQKNKHVFSQPLPERFSQAIDSIGYGSLEKVCYGILEFNSLLIRF
jgi:monoamine oxidase